jgi:hypothetical protein
MKEIANLETSNRRKRNTSAIGNTAVNDVQHGRARNNEQGQRCNGKGED